MPTSDYQKKSLRIQWEVPRKVLMAIRSLFTSLFVFLYQGEAPRKKVQAPQILTGARKTAGLINGTDGTHMFSDRGYHRLGGVGHASPNLALI